MSEAKVELFFAGDAFYTSLQKAIHKATHEICFETYIFHMDKMGHEFLKELADAAKRGVKVSLLVDGFGSMPALSSLRTFCRKNHIHFRVYHSIPFISWRIFRFPWLIFRLFRRFSRRMNTRNHRKLVLIDDRVIYVGSFNISEVHSAKYSGKKAWRDTGVRVETPAKSDLSQVLHSAFVRAWRRSRLFARGRVHEKLLRKAAELGSLRLNDRPRRRSFFARDLRQRILAAQKRILITNAYFLPRRSLRRALRHTALRGVYVGVCVPAKSDVWIVREASRTLYQKLIAAGVHIFEYQPTMLHAKTMVIDDWSVVGSHNFNHRSFLHDLEIELSFESPEVTEKLVQQWDKDLALSKEVTLDDLYDVSLWRLMISRLCYVFRYWL